MKRNPRKSLSLLIMIVGLCLQWSRADTLTGEVRGKVVDVQGRVALPEASVVLTNVDRGWKRPIPTDAAGDYLFIQLEPGNYSLTVEKPDYYRTEKTDILVPLNQPKVVIPPIELRRIVSTPTRQITLRGEQTKTAIIDLTAPGPSPVVLAYIREPGTTSLVSLLDWASRSNYSSRLIQDLPLRGGRSFDQVALLSPGVFRVVSAFREGPAAGIGVGSAGQFSVNGLRGRSNNFTVDGSDNNDEDIGVRRQGFVSLVPQNTDSVQELQIVTAGFPAEFGRNHGSMVNAVSRSGEKAHHGSLYGFFTDAVLSAGGYFDTPFSDTINAGTNDGGEFHEKDFSWNQVGGTLGGPLVADELFYLVSAERQSYRGTSMRHFVVPTGEERGLRIKDGFVPIHELGSFFSSRGIPYSDTAGSAVLALYPLPNNSAGPFGDHNYSQAKQEEGNGSILSSRLDWYLSPSQGLFGRYNFTDDNSVLPFTSDAINSALGTATRTQNISFFLNSMLPGYGSALRFSYGRTRLAFPAHKGSPLLFGSVADPAHFPSAAVIHTSYGDFGPFGATGAIGQLSIAPYNTLGIDVFNFPQGRVDNTFQVSEFLTRAASAHTLKFGFDLRRSQLNSFSDRNSRPLLLFGYGLVSSGCANNPTCPFATNDGQLLGTDLASLGAPGGFLQALSTTTPPDSTIGLRFTGLDLFIQDDWKVLPNFTLNLGLRYEIQTVPSEVNGRIERTFHLEPSQFGHLEPSGSARDRAIILRGNNAFDAALAAWQESLDGRSRIHDPDWKRIGPRFGFAWDPFGEGTAAIRAGYSLSYDSNLGAVTSQSRNVFPTLVPLNLDLNFEPPSGTVINSPVFFTFVPTQKPLIRPGTLNIYNLTGDEFATGLGTLFVQSPPLAGANLSSNGLAFTLPEKKASPASAQHLLLSTETQVGANFLVSLSYVRTRGLHLLRFVNPNAGLVATPVLFSSFNAPLTVLDLPPSFTPGATGRPVSDLGAFTIFESSATSDCNSMQASLEKRAGHGIQGRINWTWSHALDHVSDPFDGRGFFSLPQNSSRMDQERASANFDVRHRLTSFIVWEVPALWGRAALRGWKLAAVAELQTGQPFTVNTAVDRNGDGNLTDRPDSLQGITAHPGTPHPIRLAPATETFALLAPNRGQHGRVSRNSFRADGLSTLDIALDRRFYLAGEKTLHLRADILNLFNGTSFGIPVRILESPAFGRAYDTQAGPRTMRLSVRVAF
jgi:hypothetical protein